MDKEQIKSIKRHEWLLLSATGRNRIIDKAKSFLAPTEWPLIELLGQSLDNGSRVPLIARREHDYNGEQIPCGFVHPQLVAGRRWRLACFADAEHIQEIITPYAVLNMPSSERNKAMQTLTELKKIAAQMQLTIGVLGSVALECYTGLSYSNEHSDIDLIVKGATIEQIQVFLQRATALAARTQVKIDLEVELTNGYGVKALELFMDTRTVLAKGKQDVVLLPKAEALDCLQ